MKARSKNGPSTDQPVAPRALDKPVTSDVDLSQAALTFGTLMDDTAAGEKMPQTSKQQTDTEAPIQQQTSEHSESDSQHEGEKSPEQHQQLQESQIPLADQVLRSFLRGTSSTALTQPAAESVPPELDVVVHQVAEEIQVASSDREVRITLKNSVLPGTEVRIFKSDGQTQVRFVTSAVDSFKKISLHQNALQSNLNNRIPSERFVVSVDAALRSFDQNPNSDSRGRNRYEHCLLYTSPSPRDLSTSRMPSSA